MPKYHYVCVCVSVCVGGWGVGESDLHLVFEIVSSEDGSYEVNKSVPDVMISYLHSNYATISKLHVFVFQLSTYILESYILA